MSRREDDPSVEDIESEEESSDESSDEETPDEPATPSITNQSLPEVTSQLDNLHLEMGDNSNPRGRPTTPAPTGDRIAMPGGAATKVNPPMEFTGRRDQIKPFRLQCKLYWEMNPDKFSNNQRNKLLFAMSYLRGKALEWIQPHMEDFIDHPTGAGANARTLELLRNDTVFFDALKETFDVGNDTLEADRDLRALRQRTSAAAYRAEFSILAAKVGWNDDALASQFYRGLKEQVRVEITMRHDRPSTLKGMADLAIEIDSRIFEVQMEKKGNYFQGKANTKAQREVPAWKDNYYGLQKMQIDATNGKPGSNNKGPKKGQNNKRPQPQTKGTADKSNVECYGCGKKGHYKNECKARKQSHELQNSGRSNNGFCATKGKAPSDENAKVSDETRTASMRATQGRGAYERNTEPVERVEYNTLLHLPENAALRRDSQAPCIVDSHSAVSWTACYDDDCAIHMSDKEGSGWWPVGKSRSVCRTIGQPSAAERYVGGYPSPEDSSTEEESEEEEPEQEPGQVVRYPAGYPPQQEESSEEEGEASETESVEETVGVTEFTRTFYSNDPTLRLLEAVADSRPLLLPWDSEGRSLMVDESELWELFTKMRKILWDVPHAKDSINYHRIVQEFPPLGSRFTPQGGYSTPEGICITRTMRLRVMELKNEYATEGRDQNTRTAQTDKAKVYMIEQRVPIIPENYGDTPEYVRKRPMTLQERPPTPHVQAGTSAVLQRDSRMTSGYTVKPVENKSEYAVKRLLDSQNLGPRERPGLHRPVIPVGTEPEAIARPRQQSGN